VDVSEALCKIERALAGGPKKLAKAAPLLAMLVTAQLTPSSAPRFAACLRRGLFLSRRQADASDAASDAVSDAASDAASAAASAVELAVVDVLGLGADAKASCVALAEALRGKLRDFQAASTSAAAQRRERRAAQRASEDGQIGDEDDGGARAWAEHGVGLCVAVVLALGSRVALAGDDTYAFASAMKQASHRKCDGDV